MISKDSTDEQKSALEAAFLEVTKICTTKGTATDYGIGELATLYQNIHLANDGAGWVLEDMPHDSATGGIATNLQCLIGWPSKEDHETIKADAEFLEKVKPIRGIALPPKPGKSMFHVKFQGKRT
jgi:hypothetical protein